MMIFRKTLFAIIGSLALSSWANGQSITDAIRFSGTSYQANARSAGLGNAVGALGANQLSTSINPAGLGLYQQSEFTVSGAGLYSQQKSSFLGERLNDGQYNLSLNNVGIVFTQRYTDFGRKVENGWANANFAITWNRTNDYNQSILYAGENRTSSILDYFTEQANSNGLSGLSEWAYSNYIIDYDEENDTYYPYLDDPGNRSVDQKQQIIQSGSAADVNLAFGANYGDKMYIGGSVGIPYFRHRERATFEENNLNPAEDFYNYTILEEEFRDLGVGLNASLGFIVRPVNFLRIGASIKSPTVYSVNRTIKSSLFGSTSDQGAREINGAETDFSYRLYTPFKFTASAALVSSKIGLISVDYDYQDFSLMKIEEKSGDDLPGVDYFEDNRLISNNLQAVHTIRAGAELRLDPFALRFGYGMSTSPYSEDGALNVPDDGDLSSQSLSFGIGYREPLYFVDLSYQLLMQNGYSQPYSLANNTVPAATFDRNVNTVLLTVGFLF